MDIWPHVAADVEKLKGKPSLSRAEGAIGQAYQPEQMLTHVRNSPTKDRHYISYFCFLKTPFRLGFRQGAERMQE